MRERRNKFLRSWTSPDWFWSSPRTRLPLGMLRGRIRWKARLPSQTKRRAACSSSCRNLVSYYIINISHSHTHKWMEPHYFHWVPSLTPVSEATSFQKNNLWSVYLCFIFIFLSEGNKFSMTVNAAFTLFINHTKCSLKSRLTFCWFCLFKTRRYFNPVK